MHDKRCFSRRSFLKASSAAAAACAAPSIVPARALGLEDAAAPSNRITVGMIGVGRQVLAYNLPYFIDQPDSEVAALCDVDRWRLNVTDQRVFDYHKGNKKRIFKVPKCPRYVDFRAVLDRDDVDAVMISTPDHWHVPISMMAVDAGKDVCCEKPLTRSIAEGRLLADLVAKQKRVFRTDSEFRSRKNFHCAVELVRNGRIGKLRKIFTTVPMGADESPPFVEMPVPEELDYDFWQGPAHARPYTEQRVHPIKGYARPGWMNIRDYCDGMILNWTTHLNDIAQWGHGTDRTGPTAVEGSGACPPPGSLWDCCNDFDFTCTFADGVTLNCKTDSGRPHTRFEGEEGWVQASYGGTPLEAEPKSLLASKIGPDELHFPLKHEKRDFLDAVKTRGQTLEDAEVGHRTASLGHLAQIAIRLGRKLEWDPDKERFIGDDEANGMLALPPARNWASA
ncbi:MAG: Gfo/Idh/MocA family oxidoreductase [Pirellulales bacterium]|nr:Gfo/Idh/MocA family oxidoreductase [Pirellulales bacterium]